MIYNDCIYLLVLLFQVDFVVEVCSDFMVHQLSIDNYQTVLMLADKYQLGDLSGEIFRYLGVNVMQVSNSLYI